MTDSKIYNKAVYGVEFTIIKTDLIKNMPKEFVLNNSSTRIVWVEFRFI